MMSYGIIDIKITALFDPYENETVSFLPLYQFFTLKVLLLLVIFSDCNRDFCICNIFI